MESLLWNLAGLLLGSVIVFLMNVAVWRFRGMI